MFKPTQSLFFLSGLTNLFGYSSAFSNSLDIRDLLPDPLGQYQNHEIFSVEEGPEEDIVYITERAPQVPPKSCSDCAWFTPWTYEDADLDEVLKRHLQDSANEDVNATRRHLVSRGSDGKKTTIKCGDPANSEITLQPYIWPNNDQMEKTGRIYDFEPYDKPDQASYYQLKKTGKFQNRNNVGEPSNRAVSVEHILEWQVLLDFIRTDIDRCVHIVKYFNTPIDIDTTWSPIDASGAAQPKAAKFNERGIDWVAHQYPGNDASASPFTYEFVSLHDGVNGRKERLWSEASSSAKKGKGANGAAKKPSMVDTDVWKKWTVQNKFEQPAQAKAGSKRKRMTWVAATNNEGKCRAVVAFRDVVGVYRYHASPEIQKILTAQVDRIGTAFGYLESGPLKAGTYTAMATPLKTQWEAYMKAKYASVISDLNTEMETLKKGLESTKVKRGWGSLFGRGAGQTGGPLCGLEKDKVKMNARITNAIKEYESVKGKWTNPMP